MSQKIQVKELDNGIKVVLMPLKGMKAVTVEVFLEVGAKFEEKDEFGMSHFLEHMAFKGTHKRPTAESINKEIDSKGASYNAETGLETTSYHITTIKENFGWAVEMVADILENPVFEPDALEREKGVIIEEIRMYKDNPMMGLSGDFCKQVWGGNSRGCFNVSGEVENIESIDREKLLQFRDKYIDSRRIVVAVAGDLPAGAVTIVKDHFAGWKMASPALPKLKVTFGNKKQERVKRKLEQGHFCLGFPTISWWDRRRYAFRLLDIILAGNTSSRLHQKIREERGWAYYIFSAGEKIREGGFWAVQSGVRKDKLDESIEVVEKELLNLGFDLNQEEVDRAKDYFMGKIKLSMDRSDFWTGYVGAKLLLEGKTTSVEEEIAEIRGVKMATIRETTKEFISKEKFRLIKIDG
ncbi:MAG: pitrilysin family protein [Candidatus Shapirobacteria bacterium]|jgi:predicted Zn-dependent peptidase